MEKKKKLGLPSVIATGVGVIIGGRKIFCVYGENFL